MKGTRIFPGKSIGSYAVKWTNLPDSLKSSTAYRLGAYPETEFRSQLAAIREALKEVGVLLFFFF